MGFRLLGMFLWLLVVATPGRAEAQGFAHTTATWFHGSSEDLLGLRVGGFYLPVRHLRVAAEWGLSSVEIDDTDEGGLHFERREVFLANPSVALQYAFGDARATQLWIGFGATAPVASVADGAPERALDLRSYSAMRGAAGWADFWLWSPDTVGLLVPAELSHVAGALRLRFTLTGVMLVGVRRGVDGRGASLGAEAGYDLNRVTLGLRGRFAALQQGTDVTQTALEPFVRLDLGQNSAELALTMNLDRPDGFAFDAGGRWGLQVRFGANL